MRDPLVVIGAGAALEAPAIKMDVGVELALGPLKIENGPSEPHKPTQQYVPPMLENDERYRLGRRLTSEKVRAPWLEHTATAKRSCS